MIILILNNQIVLAPSELNCEKYLRDIIVVIEINHAARSLVCNTFGMIGIFYITQKNSLTYLRNVISYIGYYLELTR